MRGRRGLLLLLVIAGAVAFFLVRGRDERREVSRPELVTQVNMACEDLISAGRGLEPPYRPYGPHAESYFNGFLERAEDAKQLLEGLDPPAADAAAHSTLVVGYTQIETDLEEAQGAAATDQDPEVIARIDEIEVTTKRMVEAERALGACRGEASVAELPALLRRTVPNPLEETGEL